ncbi:30 kDa heat shock protein [Apiospora aurea]|uniref:30 kDa heat shock protein n=1 Tax=Apiospora aurea TaxID=335848 RepID=A0ABR1Q6Q0_9PEZI
MPFLSSAGQKVNHLFQDLMHPRAALSTSTTAEVRSPCTDIRESDDAYFIDVELPGVVTDDIRLNWANSRVLLVEADAQRPPETVEEEEEAEDGGKLTRVWSHDDNCRQCTQQWHHHYRYHPEDRTASDVGQLQRQDNKFKRSGSFGAFGGGNGNINKINSNNNNSGSFHKRRSSMFAFTSNNNENNSDASSSTGWKHPFHFLMRERRDCAFARAFSFHVDVDQGHVTTEVKDGLLHMRVPKLFMDDELSEIET